MTNTITRKVQNKLDALGQMTNIQKTGIKSFEIQINGVIEKKVTSRRSANEFVVKRYLIIILNDKK